MKNTNSTIIAYGPQLPDTSGAFDGALFYKTVDSLPAHDQSAPIPPVDPEPKGLYVYRFVADSQPGSLGAQVNQGWVLADIGKQNAETLDGFSSIYFQPRDSDLTALSNTTGTGIYVRTGDGTSITRTITPASSRLSVLDGSGISGNPTLDVVEANVLLQNLGGILTTNKGGTGTSISPTPGSVIYGVSNTTFGASAAGNLGDFLLSGGTGSPTFADPATLTVGNATNAVNANQAQFANQLTTPRTISLSGPITGSVVFSGASNVTITTSAANLLASDNTWTGSQTFAQTVNFTPPGIFLNGTYAAGAYNTALYIGQRHLRNVVANNAWEMVNAANSAVIFTFGNTGNFVASGDVTAFSDARLKYDVKQIQEPLAKVSKITGVTFNKIGVEDRRTGLIAQEVQAVMPEAVHESPDGTLSVAYGNLVGLLIEAVKAQQKQIDELTRRLNKISD